MGVFVFEAVPFLIGSDRAVGEATIEVV